jgi:hypothetical protein
MTSSYLNIVTFLITTIFYYFSLKPMLKYDVISEQNKYKTFISNSYMYLAIYLLSIIVIQFIVNTYVITSSCGGNITDNLEASGFLTFIPWTLIFGAVILILSIYPGFKSAFSDVIGYFYVSNSANKILSELLIDRDIQNQIEGDLTLTPEKQTNLQNAADSIIKIFGNSSILINQIVPSNFNRYWNILKPLMKDKYQINTPQTDSLKNELFDLVVSRDNVGEAMWFTYTGVLLTALVQMKITTRGCINNPKTMEQNYKTFVEEENKAKTKQQLATSTNYTLAT